MKHKLLRVSRQYLGYLKTTNLNTCLYNTTSIAKLVSVYHEKVVKGEGEIEVMFPPLYPDSATLRVENSIG